MMLYKNTKAMARSPDGNFDFFDIIPGILWSDTLAPYTFILCLNNVLRTSRDLIQEYDDLTFLANTLAQPEFLQRSLKRAVGVI